MSHRVVTPGSTMKERAAAAVADPELRRAMANLDVRLFTAREIAETSPELKDRAAAIRREVLADLDGWLDRLETRLRALGVAVHRASTPAAARTIVLELAAREAVRTVVKSKSMATEEIELAEALEAAGIEAIETDLGEYIVQVAGERPSHMIVPAIHKTLPQIAAVLSTRAGAPLPVDRDELTAWTHDHLRPAFVRADMGITGANFAAADTGTVVLVTNEGNGRLTTSLPRIHVVVMPVEKVIPRFADLAVLLPLLTRSATGQRLSNYVSMITGPRRDGELDGPEAMHVIFLDHNRRAMLGTPYEEMLACVRCGACLNVCPVYRTVSGHAYDAVYSGPMGKILTPLLSGGSRGLDLPAASTLCGACTEACPVEIPLADLLVRLRADLRSPAPLVPRPGPGASVRSGSSRPRLPGEGYAWPSARAALAGAAAPTWSGRAWEAWSRVWSDPRGYRTTTALVRAGARILGSRSWASPMRVRLLPSGRAITGWADGRDLPLPAAVPFRARWQARVEGRETW